ncbi:NB-ARC domain-containing protein [Kamptonema sp. UHCC 0994]|uniref:NB-ARC domain-containing protein n=1 Tax=Kamptonema sp. UHCC 0994 TaxID=3031329 RepID=UPI0023B9C9F7|nr:NB-ARC domain-containing protein [Kamptonema sp. UHCC 0994]MDF0552518.1 NB-ARC domain-containing protein [Kamptonema sp. UHCC 0994]
MNDNEAQALISQEFLQSIAASRGIRPAELEVLSLSLSGISTTEIASQLDISEDLVRKRLSRIYIKFQIEGRGPVKFAKLQQLLHNLYQTHLGSTTNNSPILNRIDWSEVIDVSIFYGRSEELAQLEQWIVRDSSRLIAVVGLGGIGKTALLTKLTQQIQPYFDCVIGRSLHNAPPLENLLADLLKSLSHPQEPELSEKADERIVQLISYLRDRRCLLVLDDVQTILRSNDLYGRYLQGYEGYGALFRRIAEEQHQSCLVLSSQEKLKEISLLENPSRPIHSLKLEGLKPEDAQQILLRKNLTGKQSWQELIQHYRGNPLELKLIAATIEDIFNKDVAEFVKLRTTIVSDREILDEPFKRLSALEKQVMQLLAKEDKALSFQQLRAKIEEIATSDLIEVLESLGGRYLIEKVKTQDTNELLFTLQPVIKKYVTKYHLPSAQKT